MIETNSMGPEMVLSSEIGSRTQHMVSNYKDTEQVKTKPNSDKKRIGKRELGEV